MELQAKRLSGLYEVSVFLEMMRSTYAELIEDVELNTLYNSLFDAVIERVYSNTELKGNGDIYLLFAPETETGVLTVTTTDE